MKAKIENGKLMQPIYKAYDKPKEIDIIIKNTEAVNYITDLIEAMGYHNSTGEKTDIGYRRTFINN